METHLKLQYNGNQRRFFGRVLPRSRCTAFKLMHLFLVAGCSTFNFTLKSIRIYFVSIVNLIKLVPSETLTLPLSFSSLCLSGFDQK